MAALQRVAISVWWFFFRFAAYKQTGPDHMSRPGKLNKRFATDYLPYFAYLAGSLSNVALLAALANRKVPYLVVVVLGELAVGLNFFLPTGSTNCFTYFEGSFTKAPGQPGQQK